MDCKYEQRRSWRKSSENKKNFIKKFIENLEMELEENENLYKEMKSTEIEYINAMQC
ncbi:MAG: hypothetical protein ACLSV2_10950 [Clostridium sp.]